LLSWLESRPVGINQLDLGSPEPRETGGASTHTDSITLGLVCFFLLSWLESRPGGINQLDLGSPQSRETGGASTHTDSITLGSVCFFYRQHNMKYFIYILYSPKFDKYYIGQTHDLEKRLEDHNRGDIPGESKKFTYKYRPWQIAASFEVGQDRSIAMKIERSIKSRKSRAFIREIIDHQNNIEKLEKLIGVLILRD